MLADYFQLLHLQLQVSKHHQSYLAEPHHTKANLDLGLLRYLGLSAPCK